MHLTLQCHSCKAQWRLADEPRDWGRLACPSCHAEAEAARAEDFASALEDALVQLAALSQTHGLAITLSTTDIPPSFRATPEDDAGPSVPGAP